MERAGSQHLMFIMNSAKYFVLNRIGLAIAAQEAGYHVSIAIVDDDADAMKILKEHGFEVHPFPLTRHGYYFFSTVQTYFALRRLIRKIKPTIVHSLTIKSIVLSGVICKWNRIPMVALIAGRGTAFAMKGLRGMFMRGLAKFLYRRALNGKLTYTYFQNPSDHEYFVSRRLAHPDRTHLILGSGVDTERFKFHPYEENKSKRVITLAARMLNQKGIREFAEAAAEVHKTHPDVVFQLVGVPDPGNPDTLWPDEIYRLCEDGGMSWLGFIDDMPEMLKESDIFCLPTYYPEGVPMTLLQASAMGKAVITTDTPGCRDVVLHEETGLLVPPRNSQALASAMNRLIESPELSAKVSCSGAKKVAEEFSRHKVNADTLAFYDQILG